MIKLLQSRLGLFGLSFLFFLAGTIPLRAQYTLTLVSKEERFSELMKGLKIPAQFKDRQLCEQFVNRLPGLLQSKGYLTASLDQVFFDTSSAQVEVF
ncbi:MAG: hypothetical protein ACKO6K_10180, partial [Chitinophagaceae bacterium]